MKKVKIGKKNVGNNEPCFIVFEAGATLYDLESAKKLAKVAADAKADAVKFQIMDVDRLIADKKMSFTYGTTEGKITEPLYDILKRRELKKEEWIELKKYCDKIGISFFATPFFPEEVDFLKEIGSVAIKIASGDINNYFLIEYAAKTKLPILLDNGSASISDLKEVMKIINATGNKQVIIMHTPPGYPAPEEKLNLNIINALKKEFDCPVGLSDQSPGYNMDILGIGLGADVLEKTITLDKTIKSAEHMMSLEPPEAKTFVGDVRLFEKAIGSAKKAYKRIQSEESKKGSRSIAAKVDINKGEKITEENIDFRRPGNKIPSNDYKKILGKRAKTKIKKGSFIEYSMLS